MLPLLSPYAKPLFVRTDNVTIGDVIIFQISYPDYPDHSLICHRIVQEKDGMWITKGDANAEPDPWLLPKNEVLGRLVAVFY